MTMLKILRAGPLVTLQDKGRFGALAHGISASGPMDRGAFERTARWLGTAGSTAIEITRAGMAFTVSEGGMRAAFDGGLFALKRNGRKAAWPSVLTLSAGDSVDITPGEWGSYGYIRFDREIAVEPVMGSRATSSIAGLGGFQGRALKAGDELSLDPEASGVPPREPVPAQRGSGPIRFVWGLHADLFDSEQRQNFTHGAFSVSTRLDRMGVRLEDKSGVFADAHILSLISDAIVPGDIQILGDGTPIVLMRDHQPTGGYPRVGTIISADLDRFAQLRPGEELTFEPVTLQKAQKYLTSRSLP
ncbi:MAG TPA: biotin-dependent carboxyltransferase family protein [Arsenicitalea sp.]|jgi:biotin-dependent carboxylase-like uncharacterized protein|nr:biotin-dependent carboxyltransferase family protein [Arsenicitalea sp.]